MESEYKFQLVKECSYVARLQIEINPIDLKRINVNDFLYVDIESKDHHFVRCMIVSNEKLEVGHVKVSKRCLDILGVNNEFVYVHPIPFEFVNRGIPKIDDINKKEIYASTDLIEKYSNKVELINITNGYRMFVNLMDIGSSQHSSKVFINRYHLLLLGLNQDVQGKLVITSAESNMKNSLFILLVQWLRLFFIGIFRRIGDFFIGYRELELRVGYIYPFDENHRVARMHPNIRKFLGLEENDRLVVTYNERSTELPVLDLDTEHVNEVFKIDNEFVDSHLYIGIPATTRNQLGVPNIGTVIKVRRSMKFLLMKHINKLILPLLALLFAILSVIKANNFSNIMKILIIILVISPIVVFASLSEERSKVK